MEALNVATIPRKNNIIEFKARRKLRISPGLTSELPCGGWVPEDIHQLPLMAATCEMEAVPMAGNPGTQSGAGTIIIESVEKGEGMEGGTLIMKLAVMRA